MVGHYTQWLLLLVYERMVFAKQYTTLHLTTSCVSVLPHVSQYCISPLRYAYIVMLQYYNIWHIFVWALKDWPVGNTCVHFVNALTLEIKILKVWIYVLSLSCTDAPKKEPDYREKLETKYFFTGKMHNGPCAYLKNPIIHSLCLWFTTLCVAFKYFINTSVPCLRYGSQFWSYTLVQIWSNTLIEHTLNVSIEQSALFRSSKNSGPVNRDHINKSKETIAHHLYTCRWASNH